MRQKLSILIVTAAAVAAGACYNAPSGAAGGMPGGGFQGSDLSAQVLDMSGSGETTVYQLGPDGVHHPAANVKGQEQKQ